MAKYNILVGVKLDSNSLSSLKNNLANRKDIKIPVGIKLDSNNISSLKDKFANRKDIKIPVGVKVDVGDIKAQIQSVKIKPIEIDLKISKKSLSNIESSLKGDSKSKGVTESISNANIDSKPMDSMLESAKKIKKTLSEASVNPDNVIYHAGTLSRLNKAETNGRFIGSNRGTGYFGTGHYFVDSATKHELDRDSGYSSKPYTSVDISKYNNLFRANTDELAGKLHDFLRNLTRFTQGIDKFDIPELYNQFKGVFGDGVLNEKEFESRLGGLKTFMSGSSLDDRSDSVSTQFMKSLGYGGVDTRGTNYANTKYGTVIYDLKEESVLQANVTDELQKQGQMLEKINYEKGQVFDKKEDDRIQKQSDDIAKRKEIEEEYNKSFDSTKLNKAENDLTDAEVRFAEVDKKIKTAEDNISNASEIARQNAKEFESYGLTLSDEDIEKDKNKIIENSQSIIDKYSEEREALRAKIPVLEKAYNKEVELSRKAYEQAEQVVEQRRSEAQSAQEKPIAQEPIEVTADISDFDRDVANSEKKLDDLNDTKPVEIKSDTSKLDRGVADSKQELNSLSKQSTDTTKTFNTLLSLQGRINSSSKKMEGLSGDALLKEQAHLDKLIATYSRLYGTVADKLDTDQIEKLNQRASASISAVEQTINAWERLKTITKEVGDVSTKLARLKADPNANSNQIKELENQLEAAKKAADDLRASLAGQLSTGQYQKLNNELEKTERQIKEIESSIADKRAKLASDAKTKLDNGTYRNDYSKVKTDFNKLDVVVGDTEIAMSRFENAYRELNNAFADTGNIERQIKASEEYKAALRSVRNELDINKRAQADLNQQEAQQSIYDYGRKARLSSQKWRDENSAAKEQYGKRIESYEEDIKKAMEIGDKAAIDSAKRSIEIAHMEAELAGKSGLNFSDKLKNQFKRYGTYLMSSLSLWEVVRGLQMMYENVKAVDKAMVELKRVTDLSEAQYAVLYDDMTVSAREYGAALDDIINATAGWARLGFDANVSKELAEITTMYQHIADIDVETANNNLVTAFNGNKEQLMSEYGNEVDAMMHVADVYNELGNKFAINSEQVGSGVSRAASALALAGNTLEETSAMVTAITEVTQDPEKAGNALKVVSMRVRGMAGDLEDLGEEVDENVENISKMQGKVLNLTNGRVNIFDANGDFRDFYDIMLDIAKIWDTLSSTDQATLLETIAGKHRANDVAAYFDNYERGIKAVNDAYNSAGSAEEEHAKYMDGIEGRLNSLTAAWQEFSNDFLSSDFLKTGVSVLTKLLNVIDDIVNSLGLVGTAGAGIAIFNMFRGGGVSRTIKSVTAAFNGASTAIEGIGAAATVAGNKLGAFTSHLAGKVAIAGAAVAAIYSIYLAYENYQAEQQKLRQETIDSSNEFLDSADTFEQAYAKYANKTILTSEEEADLASAVDGTVAALGDKSSALQSVVSSSDDYLNSLDAIAKAELEQSKRSASDALSAANKQLEKDAGNKGGLFGTGLFSLSNKPAKTAIEIPEADLEEYKVLKDILESPAVSKYISTTSFGSKDLSGRGHTYYTFDADAGLDSLIDQYYTAVEIKNKLNDEGLTDNNTYEDASNAVDALSSSIQEAIAQTYNFQKANYELENGIPSTIEEFYAMREAVLSSATDSVEARQQMAETMNEEFGDIFDLSSVESQMNLIDSVTKNVQGMNDEKLNTFETFFDIKTKLNDGECTVGEYSNAIAEVNDAISQVENKDAQEFLRLQLGLEIDENGNVKDEVMKLRDKLIRDFENGGVDSDIAASVADSLNKSELKAAIQLVANGKIDMSNIDSDEVKREIEEQAKLNEAIRFTVDIDVESKNLENLNTAITESLSGIGLGTESITAVKKMFEGLEGYDPSKLFERTANGMRLNTIELKKMNDEYKATNLNGLDNKLSALGDQYNQTKEELYGLTYGTDEYNEKARQLSDIEAQINATEQLAAQYEGLTSAYNEWQMAESAGTQRDMYEKVIEGFENVEDEISRGWYDDSTVEFIEMLSGKDLSSGNINKIKSAWKGLGKTIEGTSYSVKDFFTVNDDGNSTNTGVYNFLEAVDAKFDKKGIIKKDGSGNIIGFDFKVAGGDEAIAEALGVSEELVQIMVRASDDAGFVVSMDGAYQQLDVLKEKAQDAANTLKEMFKGTENEITADFDLNTDNVEDIKTQLENANAVWEKFKNIKNEDGTINMSVDGAEEAFTLVSTLQTMLDQLSEPVYMDVEVSKVSKELQEPLTQLQEYERLTQQEHQLNLKGTDTSSLQKSKNEILNYLEGLDPTIKANLGIEGLSKDELQKKIDDREVKIPATIDLQVEMNNTLRDMINVSLYNSGLITKEELEKRVDVNVYAENVDASDVDQKTEEAVENSSNQNVEVNTSADVNVEAGNVNTDSVEQGVNNAVENAFVGDGGYLYTTNTNVNVGVDNVDTSDAEQDVNNAVDNAFVGDGGYLYTISTNVDVEAGNVDTSSAEQEVDNTIENAFVGDGGYLYTTNTNVNVGVDNVDTSTAEQELNNVMNDTFVGDGGFVFDAKTDVNVDAGDVDTTNVESALTNVFNRQWFDDNISLGDNGIYVDYELEPSSTADPMDAFDNGVVVGDNGIIIDYTLKPEVEESPVENYFSDQVIGDAGFVIDYALEPEEQANPMDAFDNGIVVGDNGIIIDYTLKPEEAEPEIEPEHAKNYFADDVIGDNGVIIDYTLEPAEQENPMDAFDNSVVIGDNGMVIDYLFNADVDVSNQDELTTLEQNIASLDDKEVKVLAETFGEPSVETLYNAMGKLRDADVVAVAEAVGTGDVERLDGVLAGLTDEQIQAVCDVYGCEDAEELRSKVGSLTDKEIQALAKVMGTMDVDTLRASIAKMYDKEVEAKANVSGQTKVDSLRDSLNLLDMVKNIGINISVGVSGAIEKLKQLLGITGANGDAKIEGTARVIGSAYASGSAFARGTTGNAFAQGNWGVKGSGVALGGEVGQELVVRNGRWFTIGDNGAEFFKYQPNDIIK